MSKSKSHNIKKPVTVFNQPFEIQLLLSVDKIKSRLLEVNDTQYSFASRFHVQLLSFDLMVSMYLQSVLGMDGVIRGLSVLLKKLQMVCCLQVKLVSVWKFCWLNLSALCCSLCLEQRFYKLSVLQPCVWHSVFSH